MNKIRTISVLQDYLDAEFSWRLKEIANVKVFMRGSSSLAQATVVRAAVPLLYAHWEGFIKNAALGYVNFVSNQRLRYKELASSFIVFGAKRHLNQLMSSRQASLNVAAVDFFTTRLGERAELKLQGAIDTQSNLSSSVFENIAFSIGIDPVAYRSRYNLIDESLLRRRNRIAHGEYLDLHAADCRSLADETIVLMRSFKIDVENAATCRRYLRKSVLLD